MVSGPTAWNFPDSFVGSRPIIQAYEPYPVAAGAGSNYSSVNNTSLPLMHWNQPIPIAFSNVILENTFGAGVPAATSQASTGSEGFTYGYSAFIYSRQDYALSSSNLAPVASGSFVMQAAMGYSSTSQTMGMSWNTDTTGGLGTFTTSSSDAGWSNWLNGPRVLGLPLVTTLSAGEYWIAFQHSSTALTSNSSIVLVSASQLIGGSFYLSHGTMGGSTTAGSVGAIGANNAMVWATAAPVFSTTVAITNGVVAGARPVYFALRNI